LKDKPSLILDERSDMAEAQINLQLLCVRHELFPQTPRRVGLNNEVQSKTA
jgi:hypothetical protein